MSSIPPYRPPLLGRVVDTLGNLLLRPPAGGLGRVQVHGARTQRRVALTFDDGPNAPSTGDVLDVLAAHGVKATFFCVGTNASCFPHLVRRAYDEGHTIGNHSMHHRRRAGLQWREDGHIDACERLLTEIIGVTPRLYRAPWGWLTPWETQRLRARDYDIIGWDVDTNDWQRPSPNAEAITASVRRQARPGSILLFHDGLANVHQLEKPHTVRGVEQTIISLRHAGFTFVTVPELLALEAYRA